MSKKEILCVLGCTMFLLAGSAPAELVGYYDFSGATGGSGSYSVPDLIGSNDGTLVGDIPSTGGYVPPSQTGPGGTYFETDGTDESYFHISSAALSNTQGAVMFAFKYNSHTPTTWSSMVALPQWHNDESSFIRLRKRSDTKMRVYPPEIFPDDPWFTMWTDTNWHTVAITWKDEGTFKVYFDGNERTRMTIPEYEADDFTFGDDLYLAAQNSTAEMCFEGSYGYLATFDDELDATTVMGYHTNGIPEPTTMALLGLGGLALLRRRK